MQTITPLRWFEDQAEKTMKFCTSIFKKTGIGKIIRYDIAGKQVARQPAGSVVTVEFQIAGQDFIALNGGPPRKFTEAVSFVANCKTDAEVARSWKLDRSAS